MFYRQFFFRLPIPTTESWFSLVVLNAEHFITRKMIAVSGIALTVRDSSLFYHSAEWEFEFYNRSSMDSDDDSDAAAVVLCVLFSSFYV